MAWASHQSTNQILRERHYLGATHRGTAWSDDIGVIVVASPSGRHLPSDWLELTRWCIVSAEKNGGSKQWARFVRDLRKARPDVTTIVSYSDPSVGHCGSLYRACNWLWAPTWHRLRPPPSGNGSWDGKTKQSVKDRWVFPLLPDTRRERLLVAQDESVLRKFPQARYREPGGVNYKKVASVLGIQTAR